MNIYAVFPLVATLVFIPLLVTTVSSRPLQTRHRLFALYLITAMVWSLFDYFLRSNLSPQLDIFFIKGILIAFTVMLVQFHCFSSSFFPPGRGRWLPFAYATLVSAVVLVLLGYVPQGVEIMGDKLYPQYGAGVIFIAVPLITLLVRNLYVFRQTLRIVDNPVQYNQIISIRLGLFVLGGFSLLALLPWGREFPVSHAGNIINALILSYATIRHQLLDIRQVLRRGLAWVSLAAIGIICYWLLLVGLHSLFQFEIDAGGVVVAITLSVGVSVIVYKLRGFLFVTMTRAFMGQTYDYRQQLTGFANKIHNVFNLKEQGSELLRLVIRAVECEKAGLLFLEVGTEDFTMQLFEPKREDNHMRSLILSGRSPIADYMRREKQSLTRDAISILPEFRGLWEKEKEDIEANELELFMPLISRDRLIGVLALGKKSSGSIPLKICICWKRLWTG